MKFIKISLMIIVVLVLVAGGLVFKTLRDAGEFKKIEPHFGGRCEAVSGTPGPEDITIHPLTGMAFISSDDRRGLLQGGARAQGAIYGFDLTTTDPQLVDLTKGFREEFHPHGIGLFLGEDGKASLFVVNHRGDGHFVEVFHYKEQKLIHRASISGELMHSPNDVVPVGPHRFYVTNDHGSTSQLGRTLEDYLRMARSYVLYYDGEAFRVVAKGLAYANGINQSRDGKMIYVAATVGQKIYVYDREIGSGDLTLRQAIDAGTGVDNVELDEGGHLWVGAHPKLLTFVKHAKDPKVLSPSQVLRVTIEESGAYTKDEIYLSDGEALSASSVAAVFKDTLLIGAVFDGHFLRCQLP